MTLTARCNQYCVEMLLNPSHLTTSGLYQRPSTRAPQHVPRALAVPGKHVSIDTAADAEFHCE